MMIPSSSNSTTRDYVSDKFLFLDENDDEELALDKEDTEVEEDDDEKDTTFLVTCEPVCPTVLPEPDKHLGHAFLLICVAIGKSEDFEKDEDDEKLFPNVVPPPDSKYCIC